MSKYHSNKSISASVQKQTQLLSSWQNPNVTGEGREQANAADLLFCQLVLVS